MDQLQTLTKAFTGLGVDEKLLISLLGKSEPEHRQSLRKGCRDLFIDDERQFERWDENRVKLLKHEFVRFKNAVVLWTMHPWERDARLMKEALKKGPQQYGVIVEVACTRTADQLLGARKAYHSLFDHAVEEDVSTHIHSHQRKLLVALVSAYRYEGPKVKEDAAKSDAKLLYKSLKNGQAKKGGLEDEEVVRILSTRSKPHLKAVFNHYQELNGGNTIIKDVEESDSTLKNAVECLCAPHAYFANVLGSGLRTDVDKTEKKSVTRVIVSRSDVDIKQIGEEYMKQYGVSLSDKIEETANGNYKDLLLALVARGGN